MAKLLDSLKSMFRNRRQVNASVCIDRRAAKVTLKDADERLQEAMDKLDRTVRLRRDDFYDNIK